MAKHRARRYDEGGDIEDESDRGEMTPEQQASSNAQLASEKAASKPRIVTKEQLAASGYDNLRDYLNAEKGLKRRDGSAPSRTASKPAPETVTKEKTTMTKAPDREGGYGPYKVFSRAKMTDEGLANMRAKDAAMRNEPGIGDNIKDLASRMRKAAGITTYKKGGMASPSKRADGIARKGHTKCACGGGRM
jgi:hypothetical protein